jgi:hypothetical protein
MNCKESARWQDVSKLKASTFCSIEKKLPVTKRSNLFFVIGTANFAHSRKDEKKSMINLIDPRW